MDRKGPGTDMTELSTWPVEKTRAGFQCSISKKKGKMPEPARSGFEFWFSPVLSV